MRIFALPLVVTPSVVNEGNAAIDCLMNQAV